MSNFNFDSEATTILEGASNFISTILADSRANRVSGKMYITSSGEGAAFLILDLKTKILYDRYTITIKGRFNEALKQEDIVDVAINN